MLLLRDPTGEEDVQSEVAARRLVEISASCLKCAGCVRPPGHRGRCEDADGKVVIQSPRAGIYVGVAKDVTCPGDDITFEVRLSSDGLCSLECIPKLSLFAGGQPAWKCYGKWRFENNEVAVEVVKEDLRGPKEDAQLALPVVMRSSAIVFKGTQCTWQRSCPLPDDFNLSGWWTLTPDASDGGDIVHVYFEHQPGEKQFSGHQKDFTELRNGKIEGLSIRWIVDDFWVRGRFTSEGRLITDIEVHSPHTGFSARFTAARSSLEGGICVVCLQDFEPGEKLRDLACRHRFHEACVDPWLMRSRHCPVCRGPVT